MCYFKKKTCVGLYDGMAEEFVCTLREREREREEGRERLTYKPIPCFLALRVCFVLKLQIHTMEGVLHLLQLNIDFV